MNEADTSDATTPSTSEEGARVLNAPGALQSVGEEVIQQLKTVYDPEIPVDIFELGLIYNITIADDGATQIKMTLTSPMCPAAEELPPEVETKARSVEGITSVTLDLVWDPPWSPDKMSEAARLELGML